MEKIYDFTIIGNGVIGSFIAYNLLKKNLTNLALVGPKKRPGSASIASGAMLNVFGEIDHDIDNNEYLKRKLDIGLHSQKIWKELRKDKFFSKIFTADDTIIYRSNNPTKLEKICFESIKKYAQKYKLLKLTHPKINFLKKKKFFRSKNFFLIKGEGAIDTKKLFCNFDKYFKKNRRLNIQDNTVKKITKCNDLYKIYCNEKKIIKSRKVIITCGAFINNIKFKNSKKVLDTYYGVGNALEINDNKKILKKQIPKRTVIRSPNRGSTCGIHIVPRKENQYYLGAGSYISHKPNYNFRMGTISYLINSAENELFSKLTKLDFQPTIGFRPFSFDGRPMIGKIDDNFFAVSGTKRDGLTMAPLIANEILKFLENKKFVSKIFQGWSPLRKPISFKDQEYSKKIYVDNKIAGLLEHNNIKQKDVTRVKKELKKESEVFHKKIIKLKNLEKNFAIHPEILNTFK